MVEQLSCLGDKRVQPPQLSRLAKGREDDPTALTLSLGHHPGGLHEAHETGQHSVVHLANHGASSSFSFSSPRLNEEKENARAPDGLSHDGDDKDNQEWRYFARELYRKQKSREGGSSSSATKKTTSGHANANANLMHIFDEEERLEAGAASTREEADEHRKTANKPEESPMTPFYVKNVPPTKVGKVFEAYQKQYWEAKRRGLEDLGNGRKFFTSRGLNLNKDERGEFRKYAKRFTDMLADRRPKRLKESRENRLRRYGFGRRKTEAQCQQTKDKSQRHYLIRLLRKNLANMAHPGVKIKWTAKHITTLQQLHSRMPLKASDPLLQLYKQFLEANEGMESCIPLPEE